MKLKQMDQLEEAIQVLNGMRELCVVLEHPKIDDIPNAVFTVFEMSVTRASGLIEEVLKQEHQEQKEQQGGRLDAEDIISSSINDCSHLE